MKIEVIPEETTEDEVALDLSKTGCEKKPEPEPTKEMPTEGDSGPEAQRALQVDQLAEVEKFDMLEAGPETNSVANADAETPREEEDATE